MLELAFLQDLAVGHAVERDAAGDAKEHGFNNVAVIEKGWIGSGNVGRNTTIVRSNYLLPGNIPLLRDGR